MDDSDISKQDKVRRVLDDNNISADELTPSDRDQLEQEID
jgi:hypothetical protein